MIRYVDKIKQRFSNATLALLFVATQLVFPLAVSGVFNPALVSAAPVCTTDTAGANDEPGQKDLTKLCVDYAGVPTTVATTWNWDETGTSGANTMDACNLFDNDGNGNVDYAVCVTTTGDPASLQTTTTYSCGDAKADRCTSPATPIGSGTTSCGVSQVNTDPFPTGSSSPKDTQGACTVQLSTVGGATATLIDVCSYPSAQPNSDPSDCVIAQPRAGKLEVKKTLVPSTDSGLFNLQIDGTTRAANVGNNGTTGEVVVPEGNHSVGETAGTSTNLASYASSVSCRDLNGTGAVVASGSGATLASVPVADGADVLCIITNTASGSITIIKDAVPNDAQDFAFTATGTGVAPFSLDDDADPTLSNTQTFNSLGSGSYTFTETATTGWDLGSINCGQAAGVVVNGATVTINLTAGQNVTCTYSNAKQGTITVHKTTVPANDPTGFSITASGTATVTNPTRTLTTSQDVVYSVSQGTYAVSEDLTNTPGWTETSNTCSNLVISANNLTASCTITNTKLAKLKIIKDAVPNGPQDFSFTTSGTGLTPFSLDDDSDVTLPNNQQFNNLSPGAYTVTEGALTGWDLTGLNCTGTTNFSRSTNTLNVTLAAGEDVICTFTNTQRGSISGFKYNVNSDGTTVSVLSGWTINLLLNGSIVDTTVTDVNGAYTFTNVAPNIYTLAELIINGWTQIFAPSSVNLSAGQTSTNNNFGNFQNATISGSKFNDLNGNATQDQGEGKLSGWTINLYNDNNDADQLLNNLVTSQQTNGSGDYSFTNLPPDTYLVCEVQQTGWNQTFPVGNGGCYTIVVLLSGHNYSGNNFGNQGRGTIQVIKNVDLNADGDTTDANESAVSNWNWNIDGSGNFATSSSQAVAAGSYTVSEVQQSDYHVTASSCTGESTPNNPTTSLSVTVSAGENVVCTFTNTRNTGTITVIKSLVPTTDTGLFDLQIGGTTYKASATNGDSTGAVSLITGNYTVSELASANTGTSLSNYLTHYSCMNGQTEVASGDATTSSSLALTSNSSIVCTFTNTRKANLTIIKDAVPNDAQDFNFTLSKQNDVQNIQGPASTLIKSFVLDDDTDATLSNTELTNGLTPGTYIIHEDSTTGWDLTGVDCGRQDTNGDTVITLAAGDNTTCTFTNTKRATVVVTKYNDFNLDGTYQPSGTSNSPAEPVLANWEITLGGTTQTTGANGTTTFTNVPATGTTTLTENQQTGWTLKNIHCDSVTEDFKEGTLTFQPNPGQTVNCFVGNYHEASLLIDKANDRPNPTVVGDTVTYTITVTVPEDSGAVYNSTVTDLPPDNFTYQLGSWTAVVTHADNSTEDLKTGGTTTEPTYGSPGVWQLGLLLPGDVVTLTYRALINSIVSPGTYPDIAFTNGTSAPASDSAVVLGSCDASCIDEENGPFVGTQVTLASVITPKTFTSEVLGTTILVNTGTPLSTYQFVIPGLLIVATLWVNRRAKHGTMKGANQ